MSKLIKISELKNLIKEEIQNILNEPKEIDIENITWEDISPYVEISKSKRILLPYEVGGAYMQIEKEKDFNNWVKQFIPKYETGILIIPKNPVLDEKFKFKPSSNKNWDKAEKETNQGLQKYYSRGSGTYTGD